MNYIVLLLISSSYIISGCSSKNSNPKDYWNLGEPQVIAWDTAGAHELSKITPINKPLSKFNSTEIENSLGYESQLYWKNLDPDVSFKIETSCKEKNTADSAPLLKNTLLEKSNRIYFYSFISEKVLLNNNYEKKSIDYLCDFKITATNKIGSEHKITIKDLRINTFKQNFVDIKSFTTDNTEIFRTINTNPAILSSDFPKINYSNKEFEYKFELDNINFEIKKPSFIKCIGDTNQFELLNTFKDTIPIDNVLAAVANDNSTAFLKKCRILALVDKKKNPSLDLSADQSEFENKNQRLVWSDYFNVIFKTPAVELKTHSINIYSRYPFNQSEYIDPKIHIFDLEFINNSDKKVRIHLPDYQKFEALLIPLILLNQRPNPTPLYGDTIDAFRLMQSNDQFPTKITLSLNSEPVVEFTLEPKESKKIAIHLAKNFKCKFPNAIKSVLNPKAEMGFRVQSININSDQNNITIDYSNQGQLERFPENYTLESLLQNVKNKISLNGKKPEDLNINHLQGFPDRTQVIDTVITRLFNFKNDVHSESVLEANYYSKTAKYQEFGGYPESDFEGNFCQEVY